MIDLTRTRYALRSARQAGEAVTGGHGRSAVFPVRGSALDKSLTSSAKPIATTVTHVAVPEHSINATRFGALAVVNRLSYRVALERTGGLF